MTNQEVILVLQAVYRSQGGANPMLPVQAVYDPLNLFPRMQHGNTPSIGIYDFHCFAPDPSVPSGDKEKLHSFYGGTTFLNTLAVSRAWVIESNGLGGEIPILSAAAGFAGIPENIASQIESFGIDSEFGIIAPKWIVANTVICITWELTRE